MNFSPRKIFTLSILIIPFIAGLLAVFIFLAPQASWFFMNLTSPHPKCAPRSAPDLINVAVDYLVQHPPFNIIVSSPAELTWIKQHHAPYVSAEDFIAANPDCCKVSQSGRDGYKLGYIEPGKKFQAFVIVDYRLRAKDGDKITYHKVMGTEIPISTCGEVLK